MSNFQAFEVVDRGSETQPKVGENFNKLTRPETRVKENYCDNVNACDVAHTTHAEGFFHVLSYYVNDARFYTYDHSACEGKL